MSSGNTARGLFAEDLKETLHGYKWCQRSIILGIIHASSEESIEQTHTVTWLVVTRTATIYYCIWFWNNKYLDKTSVIKTRY